MMRGLLLLLGGVAVVVMARLCPIVERRAALAVVNSRRINKFLRLVTIMLAAKCCLWRVLTAVSNVDSFYNFGDGETDGGSGEREENERTNSYGIASVHILLPL